MNLPYTCSSVLQTVLTAHVPKEDVSSHTTEFGAYGDDPLSRAVGAATDMTQTATTHDLAVGTARSTQQVPGVQFSQDAACAHHLHGPMTVQLPACHRANATRSRGDQAKIA